jgi:hypothetical protein
MIAVNVNWTQSQHDNFLIPVDDLDIETSSLFPENNDDSLNAGISTPL